MKKKVMCMLLTGMLAVSMFAGCGSTEEEAADTTGAAADTTDAAADETADANEEAPEEEVFNYKESGEATTGFAELLKGLKF